MEWLTLDGVHWGGVGLAFLASFILGWVWYSPAVFFPVWSRLDGLTEEKQKNAPMGIAFVGTAVANLLGVILLAVLMLGLGVSGVASGAVLGAVLGLVFRGGAHFLHNGFAVRDWRISVIDAAHDTVALALAGVVLGLFI